MPIRTVVYHAAEVSQMHLRAAVDRRRFTPHDREVHETRDYQLNNIACWTETGFDARAWTISSYALLGRGGDSSEIASYGEPRVFADWLQGI